MNQIRLMKKDDFPSQSTIFLQEPIILLVPNNLMESRVASGIFASRPGGNREGHTEFPPNHTDAHACES
jgi:23S rRNA C2498 (ribose-2'-O)-methylase RlmM